MEEYQVRVVNEQVDLNVKIKALQKFIDTNVNFKSLPEEEKEDLQDQVHAMRYYSRILQSRINRFK